MSEKKNNTALNIGILIIIAAVSIVLSTVTGILYSGRAERVKAEKLDGDLRSIFGDDYEADIISENYNSCLHEIYSVDSSFLAGYFVHASSNKYGAEVDFSFSMTYDGFIIGMIINSLPGNSVFDREYIANEFIKSYIGKGKDDLPSLASAEVITSTINDCIIEAIDSMPFKEKVEYALTTVETETDIESETTEFFEENTAEVEGSEETDA